MISFRSCLNRIQAGDPIILATSRPIRAVRRFVDAALLNQVIIITLNGAIHHDAAGVRHQHSFLHNRAKNLIYSADDDPGIHFYVEPQGECFATNAIYTDIELDAMHSATRDLAKPLDALYYRTVSKVALDGRGENIIHYMPHIQSLG